VINVRLWGEPVHTRNFAGCSAAVVSLIILTACSGGGGGSAINTGGGQSSIPAPAPVTVSIGAAQDASLNGNTALQAAGSSPNFTTNSPANGTVFPFNQSVLALTPTSVTSFTPTGGATATLQSTQTVNGTIEGLFELKVPSLGLDTTNLLSDGTSATLSDGRKVSLGITTLNYTLLGIWAVGAASTTGTSYSGFAVSGYQTPLAGIPGPLTGGATYIGDGSSSAKAGGAAGVVMLPSGNGGINVATLQGQAQIDVANFSNGTLSGQLNLTATPVGGGAATPFNTVVLNGTVSGATVSGTTGVGNATGPYAIGGGIGTFSGAFYGPMAQEVGGVWSVHEPTPDGGRTALGVFGATKQ
jgi:hypothetical protein